MRYEAIGCGVYEVDPTAAPGDPDERRPIAHTQHTFMAPRIAASLNGSEALVEALGNAVQLASKLADAHAGDLNHDPGLLAEAILTLIACRAALSAVEPAEVVG